MDDTSTKHGIRGLHNSTDATLNSKGTQDFILFTFDCICREILYFTFSELIYATCTQIWFRSYAQYLRIDSTCTWSNFDLKRKIVGLPKIKII